MPPTNRVRRHLRPPAALCHCVVGEALAAVRVWSEAEWAGMTERERPTPAEFLPGLGWVAAGPVRRPG